MRLFAHECLFFFSFFLGLRLIEKSRSKFHVQSLGEFRMVAQKLHRAVTPLADALFSIDNGIGLSAWRFNVGAGSAEQGDDSRITDPFRRAELLILN